MWSIDQGSCRDCCCPKHPSEKLVGKYCLCSFYAFMEVLIFFSHPSPCYRHAENLLQLDIGKKIPPSGWKCEKCDLTTNLWLNLTDGSILCGRKFFDGSGGNNHAVEHFNEVHYPLAVKLGTITATSGGLPLI